MPPFGAVMAGGQSRRYGAPKALARVGGERIIDRVVSALSRVTPDVILIANEPALFEDLGLPQRPDVRPGVGALGGIHAALVWARAAGRPGILAVACDMPFPCVPLLTRLNDLAFGDEARDGEPAAAAPDVVVPESGGRRGVEPLFAAYRTACIPAIEARLDRDEAHVIGFYGDVAVRRVPRAEVESMCDPERAFLNINTPAERDRAESMAGGSPDGG